MFNIKSKHVSKFEFKIGDNILIRGTFKEMLTGKGIVDLIVYDAKVFTPYITTTSTSNYIINPSKKVIAVISK